MDFIPNYQERINKTGEYRMIANFLESAKVATIMIGDMFTRIPIELLPYAFISKGRHYHVSRFHSPKIGAICPSCSHLGLKTLRTPVY